MFPSHQVVDGFNRGNGVVGTNWGGGTSGFGISGNQLNTLNNDAWMMWKTRLGATQEVYVTLQTINPAAVEIDLLLKAQSNAAWTRGVIEVWYQPSSRTVKVLTYFRSA